MPESQGCLNVDPIIQQANKLLPLCLSSAAALLLSPAAAPLRPQPVTARSDAARLALSEQLQCQDEDSIRADAETAFALLDLDGNGEVSAEEFQTYLQQFRYTESAIAQIFAALDMDGCGQINLADLRDGLAEYCRCSVCETKFKEQTLAEADMMFARVDENADGSISGAELRAHLLSHDYTEAAADAVFRSLDADSSGDISREELQSGILKYSMLREAMVAVVSTLVKNKQWGKARVV